MSREETMNTRVGEMMDLLACRSISKGAEPKQKKKEMTFDEVLALR